MALSLEQHAISTNKLAGVRVVAGDEGSKRIGKVRHFVFHPKQKRCIGFTVKRPDIAWMFHRKDAFVPIDQFKLVDGQVQVDDNVDSSARAACKRLDVDWNQCVFLLGLPMMLEDSQVVGRVGNVLFEQGTGKVLQVESDSGATANLLLGKRSVPVDLIKGFRTGMGEVLSTRGGEEDEEKAIL